MGRLINLLKGLAQDRIDELDELKQAAAETQESIKCLSSNDVFIRRLASQAEAINKVLPMQMIKRIDVHVNRAGVTTIKLLEYRTLPVQYFSSELKRIGYA